MKMKLNLLILLAATIMLSISCKQKNKANKDLAPNVHEVIAEEVIQSSNYTYVRVSEDSKETWIAISRRDVETGKSYYYEPRIEINSIDLDDTGELEGRILISIDYTVNATNTRFNFVYPFYKNEATGLR